MMIMGLIWDYNAPITMVSKSCSYGPKYQLQVIITPFVECVIP
jgi:hypothetical protein